MDRNKWEYKKLGEVCAPKTDILRANKLFGKDDVIEYIDISSIDNSAHYITQPTSYLFHEAPSRAQQKVEQGDILYSLVRPNLKNIAVVTSSNTEKYVASSGFCVLRSKDIDNRYLYHLVLSNPFTDYILGLVSGANYPAVREDDVKGFSFRCPSITDQQRIVAELDCLNEMIAVKQEQLKEFDKLAQSIFYDMFGDIESNSKAFELVRLDKVCSLKAGKAIKAEELHEKTDGLFPCYGGNGIRGYIDRYSHDGIYPIIGRQGALCGNINLAQGKFYATEHAVVVSSLVEMDSIWLSYTLESMKLEKHAHMVSPCEVKAHPHKNLTPINPKNPSNFIVARILSFLTSHFSFLISVLRTDHTPCSSSFPVRSVPPSVPLSLCESRVHTRFCVKNF